MQGRMQGGMQDRGCRGANRRPIHCTQSYFQDCLLEELDLFQVLSPWHSVGLRSRRVRGGLAARFFERFHELGALMVLFVFFRLALLPSRCLVGASLEVSVCRVILRTSLPSAARWCCWTCVSKPALHSRTTSGRNPPELPGELALMRRMSRSHRMLVRRRLKVHCLIASVKPSKKRPSRMSFCAFAAIPSKQHLEALTKHDMQCSRSSSSPLTSPAI